MRMYVCNIMFVCLFVLTLAHTQAADARRALPCWDEPAHKATFDVILVVPRDRVALSNMVSDQSDSVHGNQ